MKLAIFSMSIVLTLDVLLMAGLYVLGLNDTVLMLMSALAIHVLVSAAVIRLLMIFAPIQEGEFDLSSPEAGRWMAQAVVALISAIYFDPFVPFMLRPHWYRLFGARIGSGVNIGGRVIDFSLTTMHNGAQLGGEGMILGHNITRDRINIGRVTLEANALAGARCMLYPGVTIKEGGVVGAMSLVPAGRTIGIDETWTGNPAIRVSLAISASDVARSKKKTIVNEASDSSGELTDATNLKLTSSEVPQTDSSATESKPFDVEIELKKFLQENCWGTDSIASCGEDEASENFDEEMLDSLGWIQLLTFVNKRFGVQVSDTEVADDCDWSIRELAQLIHAKKVA